MPTKKLDTSVTATLFIIGNNWKQLKYPSIDAWKTHCGIFRKCYTKRCIIKYKMASLGNVIYYRMKISKTEY